MFGYTFSFLVGGFFGLLVWDASVWTYPKIIAMPDDGVMNSLKTLTGFVVSFGLWGLAFCAIWWVTG